MVSVGFTYAPKAGRISAIEPFLGKSGWLDLAKVTVASVETDEALVLSARLDDGTEVDSELFGKLLSLDGVVAGPTDTAPGGLEAIKDARVKEVIADVERRNARHFDEEVLKLDRWAEVCTFVALQMSPGTWVLALGNRSLSLVSRTTTVTG